MTAEPTDDRRLTQFQLVPLSEIEEDPNQPRQTFDRAGLEDLAAKIEMAASGSVTPWRDGLFHPILIYLSPAWHEGSEAPKYRILAGARRFRVYLLRNWPAIPARVVDPPTSVAITIRTQLDENHGRAGTSLWEDSIAVQRAFEAWKAESAEGTVREFAQVFGRSRAWISQRLSVARAEGLGKQALVEGHIQYSEAYRLFVQLPFEAQRQLVTRARSLSEPISLPLVRQLQAQLGKKGPDLGTTGGGAATAAAGASRELESKDLPPATERRLLLRLRPSDVRYLLWALNVTPPEDETALISALEKALTHSVAA
jgi:ParB/RepB/Spo0J family partition protein